MAAQVRRDEKSAFVTRLEGVLPLLRERFGVAKIGIFGSTARGEARADSDVDVLVEFAPGQTTFRNFMELVFYREDLFGRQGGSRHRTGAQPVPPAGRRAGTSSGVKRDELFLRHILDETAFLREVGRGLTYDALLADPVRQRAVVRSIEIIGEATKNLSEDLKGQYPGYPLAADCRLTGYAEPRLL